jgi:hypothetical protein
MNSGTVPRREATAVDYRCSSTDAPERTHQLVQSDPSEGKGMSYVTYHRHREVVQ